MFVANVAYFTYEGDEELDFSNYDCISIFRILK